MICPICEKGELRGGIDYTYLNLKKEGVIAIRSEVSKCDACGETFLDEKQAKDFAKKVDKKLTALRTKTKGGE